MSSHFPKAEHDAPEWQAAMEALILVEEKNGPTMLARIGVMRALSRHVERVFNPSRKDKKWGNGSWRGTDEDRPLNSDAQMHFVLQPSHLRTPPAR